MAAFLLRRLAGYLLLVVLAASLAYLLAAAALRPRADVGDGGDGGPRPSGVMIDARRPGPDLTARAPLAERYGSWVAGIVRGDFGRTYEGRPVNGELWRRLGVSVRLLGFGAVLGSGLGIALGAYAAVQRGRAADRLITAGFYLLLAVPVFVLAVLVQMVAGKVNEVTGVRWFAWLGEAGPGASDGPFGLLGGLGDRARHLLLPTAVITLAQLVLYGRYQRGLMLDVVHADFVRTARAKGLRRRDALVRHGLRTALIPMTTYFAYTFGLLLLSGVFIEKLFGWHGMGEWLVDSIARGDVNVVAAIECVAVWGVMLAGLASDVMAGVLDPRIRTGSGG